MDPNSLGQIVAEIISPVMKTIGKLLENNTAALEQLSSAQSVQNDRLEALEKQIRLQTLVTSKQVYYLNDAIRMRARRSLSWVTLSASLYLQGTVYQVSGTFQSTNTMLH